jgi:hypothetical protein
VPFLLLAQLLGVVPALAPAAPHVRKAGHMNLAFVLLERAGMPAPKAVLTAFPTFAGPQERLSLEPGDKSASSSEVLTFHLTPGGTVLVAAIPFPVPNGEADSNARFSVSSLGTGWHLPAHHAQLVVTLQGSDTSAASARECLSAFTSFLAAVISSSHAVGVYWGNAGATHDPAFFLSTAKETGTVPRLLLWTGLSLARESNGRISLLSLGMTQLALPDLLLTAPASEGNAALAMFFDLLGDMVDRGTPLPEGDTVGRSADERLPVHYVPSPTDPAKQVWRVDLP